MSTSLISPLGMEVVSPQFDAEGEQVRDTQPSPETVPRDVMVDDVKGLHQQALEDSANDATRFAITRIVHSRLIVSTRLSGPHSFCFGSNFR